MRLQRNWDKIECYFNERIFCFAFFLCRHFCGSRDRDCLLLNLIKYLLEKHPILSCIYLHDWWNANIKITMYIDIEVACNRNTRLNVLDILFAFFLCRHEMRDDFIYLIARFYLLMWRSRSCGSTETRIEIY